MELLILVLGIWIGWNLNAWRIMRRLTENPDDIIKSLEKVKALKKELEQEQSSIREIRIERYGSILYLFAKDTNEFLAQGPTLQSALEIVEKRFPDQSFNGLLSKEEADRLGITVK